ncbi:MAG: FixH family protein [Labilithrix sp.]|nr:FixH family protein [Labilithrix sp.]MCW5813820.1 FixH family protein [Labilithrix sp.]
MRVLFVLPALLALVACSGDDDGGATGSTSGAGTACAADTRKDVYTPGMAKLASDLQLQLVDSAFTPSDKPVQPGQVQKGMNAITVEVLDANKAPLDGANVSLSLWMPDHAHGSARTPKVTPMGGGKYEISEVWLPMAGLWRFRIGVTANGAPPKEADFNFCIDG